MNAQNNQKVLTWREKVDMIILKVPKKPWSLSFTYYTEEHAKPQRNIPTSGGEEVNHMPSINSPLLP